MKWTEKKKLIHIFSLERWHILWAWFMIIGREREGGEENWENKEKVKGHELFIVMNIYDLIRFRILRGNFSLFFSRCFHQFFSKKNTSFLLVIKKWSEGGWGEWKGCEDLWRGKNVFLAAVENYCGFHAILQLAIDESLVIKCLRDGFELVFNSPARPLIVT